MATPSPIKTNGTPSYSEPTLTVYGDVAKLTAAGTQALNEPGGNPTPSEMTRQARP